MSGHHSINQNLPSAVAAAAAAAAAKEHEMVGLSVILESSKDLTERRGPQVVSKGAMIKPPSPAPIPPSSSSSSSSYSVCPRTRTLLNLSTCFLCKQKLLPGKDIYMYKGDKAFCSEECRFRQIFMDEEVAAAAKSGYTREDNCSLAATTSSSSSSSSASTSSDRSGKGPRNGATAFVF